MRAPAASSGTAQERPPLVRSSGITSRILSYDVSAIYGDVSPPQEISHEYRYSLDTLHTNQGIDGHTMQFGWLGEGQADGARAPRGLRPVLMGRDRRSHGRNDQDARCMRQT